MPPKTKSKSQDKKASETGKELFKGTPELFKGTADAGKVLFKGTPNTNKPTQVCRTKAQIAEDLSLSGSKKKGKPTKSEVRRSLKAAREQTRKESKISKDLTQQTPVESSKSSKSKSSKSHPTSTSTFTQVTPAATSTSHSSKPQQKTSKQVNSPVFEKADYVHIFSYLSQPKIRNIIFGSGKQTKVTCLPMSPTTVLNNLAQEINNDYNTRNKVFSHSQSRPNKSVMQLTGKTLRDRLSRYKTAYIKARNWRDGTGAGTDENGDQRDLTLINEILEGMCPCFDQMDAIFKDKPNIVAFGILDSGVDNSQQNLQGNSDGVLSDLSFANRSPFENGSAHNAYDDDDDDYIRPKTQQESYSALQRVIKSFKDQEEQYEYDFCPLPPVIEPPANYNAFVFPSGFTTNNQRVQCKIEIKIENENENNENEDEENKNKDEENENEENEDVDELAEIEAETNNDNKENEPIDIDEMEVKRLLNEDIEEETFIPSDLVFDSDNSEILVPPKKKTQPSQQALQKRGCKSNALTPSKLDLNSNNSETAPPPKKKAKGKATLSSRTMDPLPPIDPSTVRSRETKNPIALALMNGSQARMSELKANNKRRQAAEVFKSQEANRRLNWEKVTFKTNRLDAKKQAENEAARAAIAERAKFA
ncbi:hypothetical protein DFH28DRAFT_1194434 [Melampsora americana]|nr:hypothetical protein DFH28DRAFT_1194434 [Melampsora americana]